MPAGRTRLLPCPMIGKGPCGGEPVEGRAVEDERPGGLDIHRGAELLDPPDNDVVIASVVDSGYGGADPGKSAVENGGAGGGGAPADASELAGAASGERQAQPMLVFVQDVDRGPATIASRARHPLSPPPRQTGRANDLLNDTGLTVPP
jgi:hypothetical protein